MRSIGDIIADKAAERGDAAFVAHEASGFTLGYSRLPELAAGIRGGLDALDAPPEAPVALLLHNHWIVFPILAACAERGTPVVPLSPELHPDALRSLLKQSGCRLLVHDSELEAEAIPRRVGLLTPEALMRAAAASPTPRRVGEAQDRPLLVIYTSGTTSKPKGVVLTERNLVLNAAGIAAMYGLSDSDTMLCVLPTHHINALMITGLVPLSVGARVILSRPFRFDVAKFYLDKVREHGVTVLSVTPAIMAVATRMFPKTDLSAAGVRFALCGTAPLPDDLWHRFEDHFSIPVYQGYGLTETTCWATMNRPAPAARIGTVGVPVNCEVSILDEDESGVGEVLIRGPILMKEYIGAKDTIDKDGFLHTGDLGRFDESGDLLITGRIKDIIIRSGVNIVPADIEGPFRQHPAVLDVATVGVPDPVSGENVYTAWTSHLADPPSDRELRQWLAERVSAFLVPDRVVRMGRLPRTATGKVVKKELVRLLTGEATNDVIAAVNTRKWVRYKLDDQRDLRSTIQAALLEGEPLRFVKYWGFGSRPEANDADRASLERLRELLDLLEDAYDGGTDLTLLFTDMHFRVNDKDLAAARQYMAAIDELARERGFRTMLSSTIWAEDGLDLESVRREADSEDVRARFEALECRGELVEQAHRHSGQQNPVDVARLYYHANQVERESYERRFAGHIFLTYNRDSQDALLPRLPKIYVHSYKRNVSEKPWFTDSIPETTST